MTIRLTGKPKLLDLFCGGGGAAKGYIDAGFNVTGVDIVDHSEYYPAEFVQDDAVDFVDAYFDQFDVIHASPPCPRYSMITPAASRENHPDLVEPTRAKLLMSGLPWVMENVPGSPLRKDLVLCGSHFDLIQNDHLLKRHRIFELSGVSIPQPTCKCKDRKIAGIYGNLDNIGYKKYHNIKRGGVKFPIPAAKTIMGHDMPPKPLSQAIPAAYTRYIGKYLMQAI